MSSCDATDGALDRCCVDLSYIFVQPAAGFNNQLRSIYSAAAFARALNRTVRQLPVHTRRLQRSRPKETGAFPFLSRQRRAEATAALFAAQSHARLGSFRIRLGSIAHVGVWRAAGRAVCTGLAARRPLSQTHQAGAPLKPGAVGGH